MRVACKYGMRVAKDLPCSRAKGRRWGALIQRREASVTSALLLGGGLPSRAGLNSSVSDPYDSHETPYDPNPTHRTACNRGPGEAHHAASRSCAPGSRECGRLFRCEGVCLRSMLSRGVARRRTPDGGWKSGVHLSGCYPERIVVLQLGSAVTLGCPPPSAFPPTSARPAGCHNRASQPALLPANSSPRPICSEGL